MTAIQDQMVGNGCFGCGPDNPKGMQIKSHWEGDECVCRYTPKPEQCAGPPQWVYGGTIASLIDCHSISTAVSNYARLENRAISDPPAIWCVTGRLTVSYLAPTPIDRDIELRATIEDCGERKTVVECKVLSGGKHVAQGSVIAIRVDDKWTGS